MRVLSALVASSYASFCVRLACSLISGLVKVIFFRANKMITTTKAAINPKTIPPPIPRIKCKRGKHGVVVERYCTSVKTDTNMYQ